jgi:hypothetical protein
MRELLADGGPGKALQYDDVVIATSRPLRRQRPGVFVMTT